MTMRDYLMKHHLCSETVVGDFARDVQYIGDFPEDASKLSVLLSYMRDKNAPSECHDAACDAWALWQWWLMGELTERVGHEADHTSAMPRGESRTK